MQRVLVWFSHGLGLGLIPKAPGTYGSLLGLVLVLGVQRIHPAWGCAMFSIPVFLAGIPICRAGQRHFGKDDPGQVVFDEIAAFLLVFLLVPLTWTTALIGFLLFRLFDIAKPWPVKRFEQLPGPWGVMADDTVAGLIAGILLWIIVAVSAMIQG